MTDKKNTLANTETQATTTKQNNSTPTRFLQHLENLPDEILSQPRFFKVGADKIPLTKGWSKPDNQKLYSEIDGYKGFDTAGHDMGDDYLFLDFDNVLDTNSNFINDDARYWYEFCASAGSYCERSISKTGLHILLKPTPDTFAPVSNGKNGVLHFGDDAKLEIFYRPAARYCLMTGDLFNCQKGTPIAEGEVADKIFQTLLDEIQKRLHKDSVKISPAQIFIDTQDYDSFRARKMLDKIPLRDLEGNEWLATMSALKNLGFNYEELDLLNQGGKHYNEKENRTRWNSLDDHSFNIETLHGIAKNFGYDEKSTWHEYHAKNHVDNVKPEPNDPISIWQQESGDIEPKLLTKLKTQAERIQAVSDFAQAATDTTTLKYLGAFQYYSFFIHIRNKFFADLKRKKEDAAFKIKKYNNLKRTEESYIALKGDKARDEIAACKPSDAELALIGVNITATKNKVDTYETDAKKAHRQYLKQKEIDALNAKYNAERDAYEKNPPSTKSIVSDCPIDLILPLGIYFDNSKGIRIVDFDKPVGKNGRPVIEACQNLVVPVRAFREVTKRGDNPKSKDQYEVAIKTANHWRRVIIDARTLQDARAVSALADFGAHITEPRMMAKYFAKIISLNEKNERLKVTRVYLQPGWQDRDFKFFAYPTGGDDYIVKNGDFDYSNIFTPYGDINAWTHMLHQVLFHDPKNYSKDNTKLANRPNLVAAMVLGSTFGAPLVAPLGIRNQQMVLGFDSGNGKTAAAKFATSFFGNPDELCPTCNATENFLEDLAVKLDHFPHAVDELQSAKKHVRENMDELIYKFSGGTTRGRADIQGNAKPTFHYHGFRIFTGEQTIISNSSGQGAISRVFEITKSELFADPFAIDLHNFTQNHFGFFGKYYTTEFIPHNLARIRERFKFWRDGLTTDNSPLLSSHATFLAYTLTGIQFGLEAVGYSEEQAIEIATAVAVDAQELIDNAPNKSMAKNVNRALPDIIEYLDARPTQFITEIHTSNEDEFRAAESNQKTLGVKLLNGNYAISPLNLREIINELGYPSANAIIRALGENGYLDCGDSKSQKYKKRLPEHFTRWFGKSVWFYIIKVPKEPDTANAA